MSILDFFLKKKPPMVDTNKIMEISAVGSPLHLNTPSGKNQKKRHIVRILNCTLALAKPGISKERKTELEAEIEQRRALMLAVGVDVPREVVKIEALLKEMFK